MGPDTLVWNEVPAHGGDIVSAAERWGLPAEVFIDFSASINPLGPPPRVLQALSLFMPRIVDYPDPACRQARQALSRFLEVDPRCVALGNGAAEIIWLLPRLLKPRRVLLPVPSFTLYERALGAAGTEISYLCLNPSQGFALPFEQVMRSMDGDIEGEGSAFDLIWLANPNNPTGRILPEDRLLALAEACIQRRVVLVVDEAFILFLPDWRRRTLVHLAAQSEFVIVIGSLTKFFAIPGLRLGYLVGSPSLIERLQADREPWPVNTLAQVACVEALSDPEYMARTHMLIEEERAFLMCSLEAFGWLKPFVSEANFLLVELMPFSEPLLVRSVVSPGGWDLGSRPGAEPILQAPVLCDLLGRRGILVRDCSNFRGLSSRYIRMSVRCREDNIRLLQALQGLNSR